MTRKHQRRREQERREFRVSGIKEEREGGKGAVLNVVDLRRREGELGDEKAKQRGGEREFRV